MALWVICPSFLQKCLFRTGKELGACGLGLFSSLLFGLAPKQLSAHPNENKLVTVSPLQERVASGEPGTSRLCIQPEMRDRVRLDPLWVVRSLPRQVALRPSKPTARDSRSSVRSCYKLLMPAMSPLEGWLSGVSYVTCYEMQEPLFLMPSSPIYLPWGHVFFPRAPGSFQN